MEKRVVSSLLSLCLIVALLAGFLPINASAATTYYVGYLKSNGTSANVVGGTSGVPDIYILSKSDYESSESKRTNGGTVAYCFNKSNHEPYNQLSGWWKHGSNEVKTGRCLYTKIENATAAQFTDLADYERVSGEEFRKWIISIGLNGYPLDYSGFNKAADGSKLLSDEEFRTVTQWAVWYYTDSYNPYGKSSTTPTGNAKIVYDKLVSTLLPDSVTAAGVSSIDLYKSEGGAFTNTSLWTGYQWLYNQTDTNKYQNLLAVSTTSNPNLQTYHTLTLTKSVENQDGTTNSGDFTFQVTLSTSDFWYETSGGANIAKDGNKLSVDLANSDSITIYVAGSSFDYTITEDSGNYTPTATVDGTLATFEEDGSLKGTAKANTTVAYKNTEKEADKTTGVGMLTLQKLATTSTIVPDSVWDDAEFTFTVKLTRSDKTAYIGATEEEIKNDTTEKLVSPEYGVTYTKKTAKETTEGTQKISTDGTVSFKLKKDETVTLYLPAGVHYSVTETDLPNTFSISKQINVTNSITANETKTATITNGYNNQYRVHVTKVWDDEGHSNHRTAVSFNVIGKIDDSVIVNLTQNTNSTSNWSGYYTRTRYSGQKLINYSVTETSTHEGYTSEVTETEGCDCTTTKCTIPSETFTITNKYDENLLSTISITKELAEGTTSDQAFPFTVTLSDPVYDGVPTFNVTGKSATVVNSTSGTTITFSLKAGETVTIPALYSGTKYTVTENETEGYDVYDVDGHYTVGTGTTETELDADGEVVEGTISNKINTPWHINLTYVNEKEETTTKLTATKVWANDENTGRRPDSVKITLHEQIEGGEMTATQHTYTLNEKNSWTQVVTDLAKRVNGKDVTYALREDEVPEGYTVQTTTSTDENDNPVYTFTNTYNEDLLNKLVIGKVLENGAADDNTEFTFTVTLSDPDYNGTLTSGNGSVKQATVEPIYHGDVKTGVKITFTLKAGETVTLPAIYSGTHYTVTEEETEGYQLSSTYGCYDTKETEAQKIVTQPLGNQLTANNDGEFSGLVSTTANDPYVIRLTYINKPLSSLTIQKVVSSEDSGTEEDAEPSEPSEISKEVSAEPSVTFPFTVTIYDPSYHGVPADADGNTISYETETKENCIVYTIQLTDQGTVTFPNLKSGTEYKVEEGTTDGYTLKETSGSYLLVSDADAAPTEIKASTDGVFDGTVGDGYRVVLVYTNQVVKTTEEPKETDSPKPTESPKPSESPETTPETTPTVEPSPSPSVEVTPAVETTTTPETTPTTTESASTKKTETKSETSTKSDKTEQKASTLPQTGAKWGLVIILTLAGLAVMTVGLILRRKHEEQ
jgi:TQXA domain-containing protein